MGADDDTVYSGYMEENMAKTKLNPILEQVHGKIGNLVFKQVLGETVLSRSPDRSGLVATDAQNATRVRFRQATLYGKMVMADPTTKAIYEEAATAKGQPLFSLTIADFFNAPSIDEVDLSGYAGKVGDEIVIRAHDDFAVVSVTVAITNANGQAIEEGAATETPSKSGRWVYAAKQAVPTGTQVRVNVTAEDRPGHTDTQTVTKN
jgi:hypothetical protein